MRVDERSLSEQVSASSARAAEAQRIEIDTAETANQRGNAADRVDLSSLAGRIAQSLHTMSQQSAQRVSRLQEQYQAGAYQPSAGQIAGAMVKP